MSSPAVPAPSPDASTDDGSPANPLEADPLAWVSQILWPDGSSRLVPEVDSGGGSPSEHPGAGGPGGASWWASPSAREPRLLIPADSMAAAKLAVRRYHDGFDLRRWARSVAAEVSMWSPTIAAQLLGGQTIVVDGPDDATQRGVLGGIHEVLGRDDLRFAISLATPKTNRKPVIQILDADGLVLGWAKVAWNPWTEGLVANEARWLDQAARPPLVTPLILADTVLAGRRVVISSAVAPGRRPVLRRSRQPDRAVLQAIAARGTMGHGPVTESAWWGSVESVLGMADADEREAIERVVANTGDLQVRVGAWHGDFTPWNVMTVRGLAQVIDWEFAADGVPFGFDLCHFHTQVAAEMLGLPPERALDHSARLSPQGLAGLGVDPHTQIATWQLYLVELIRRTLALRAAGLDTGGVRQGYAAVHRLTPRRSSCQPEH